MNTPHSPTPSTAEPELLVSPQSAAFQLLEAATLLGYQSGGADGLSPVRLGTGNRVAFRVTEVNHIAARIGGRES